MDERMEKFAEFYKLNPLGLTQGQLNKAKREVEKPKGGTVCDEYVEFVLWEQGLKSRQEYFAEYVETLFPAAKYPKLLEVGCGRKARLAELLTAKGYQMTAMDPMLAKVPAGTAVRCEKAAFDWGTTDIEAYDAIVAQEPCDATEHIVRACVAQQKNFVISLCGTAHRLLDGTMPETVYDWYVYLEKIGGEHCLLLKTEFIPGYVTFVILGMF